ncbi:MAG: FapA family protein [Clostridium sp.]|nr:FapA family protein [Clostridium sp.]
MEIGAKICNGEIVVIDGSNGEKITIKATKHVNLFINDESRDSSSAYEVSSKDKISYTCEKIPGKRMLNITLSEDKMKAYIEVNYEPEITYKLKDRGLFLNLALSTEKIENYNVPHYTVQELKDELKKHKIIHGINEDELEFIKDGTFEKVIIAKGEEPVNDIPSDIKLLFTPSQMVFPDEDSNEMVDYKNLFRISNVNCGDKIAEIIPEVKGKDGINVLGQTVKREYIRSLPITAVQGCEIKDNDVIATIDGKAHISNRRISVNPVYSIENVNMETCNIKFYGDIEVYDSVQDNMAVSSGGSLDVSNNVNTSHVVSGGDVNIIGNAINSRILSGQIDIRKKEYSDALKKFKKTVNEMIQAVHEVCARREINDFALLVKALTEERFKDFQKHGMNILSLNIKNRIKYNKLNDYIKDHVLGYNILKLKTIKHLLDLDEIIENEIDYYDKNIIVPLDIRIGYCQDCEIKSTGNIVINGKGEYTSNLSAMKDILFTKSDSVARGGRLTAEGNISAGIVGSEAGVATELCVPKSGKISATFAYRNTIFKFGNAKKILERDVENINVVYDRESHSIIMISSGR